MPVPKMPRTGTIYRPTVSGLGELVIGSGTSVACSVFERRAKSVLVNGEVRDVNAIGFLPSGTDVLPRDQLVVDGVRFEVVRVVSGIDAWARTTHVGVELRDKENS